MILLNTKDEVIRKINIEDEIFLKTKSLYLENFKDSEGFFKALSDTIDIVAVDMDKDKVVSSLYVRLKILNIDEKTIDFPFILGVCTDKDYRHQGRSTKVLNTTLKYLKDKFPFCLLKPKNEDLFEFYKKVGFKKFSYFSFKKASLSKNSKKIIIQKEDIADTIFNINKMAFKNYKAYQVRDSFLIYQRLYETLIDDGFVEFYLNKDCSIGYILGYYENSEKVVYEAINVELDTGEDFIIREQVFDKETPYFNVIKYFNDSIKLDSNCIILEDW